MLDAIGRTMRLKCPTLIINHHHQPRLLMMLPVMMHTLDAYK
jgi:hypothetical protein